MIMDATELPMWLKQLLAVFKEAEFAAYLVGGAVRDRLIGREPKDFDIVTAARPEQIVALARQSGWKVVDKLGQNFGVVLVVVDGNPVEIATYRSERYGEDSHRPDVVWYADTLAEDLARRDFTINAMALDERGTVVDLFGGREDLAKGIIRTVRKAEERFGEDGLRMFRACRFAAQLGFTLEKETAAAIGKNLQRVQGLSLERVKMELERLLTSPWPERGLDELVRSGLAEAHCRVREDGKDTAVAILPELVHLVDLPQNPEYHVYDAWRHTLAVTALTPPELLLRWAGLLHDVGKGLPGVRGEKENGQPCDHGHEKAGSRLTADILARLRYPAAFNKRVAWLVDRHMHFGFARFAPESAVRSWVRREARSGCFRNTAELAEGFRQLGELGLADARGTGKGEADRANIVAFQRTLCGIAIAMPVHTADLHYEMDTMLPYVGEKRHIGPFLRNVLKRVQDGQLANTPEEIVKAAERWGKREGRLF